MKTKKQENPFKNSIYLGFFAYVYTDEGRWKLRVNWLRFLILALVLGTAGFFGLTTMNYLKYSGSDVKEVTYWDAMAYPFSRETRLRCRRLLGDKIIKNAFEAKDPGSLIGGIRAGLKLSPGNPDARIYYSYMMFYQRMYREACKFLSEGVKHAFEHQDYINYFVHRTLACTEDDILQETVLETLPLCQEKIDEIRPELEDLIKKIEAAGGADVPENRPLVEKAAALKQRVDTLLSNKLILQVGLAQSLILRGHFEEARERIEEFGLRETTTGKVLYAQILWETDDKDSAILFLDNACKASNNNLQVVLLRAMYLDQLKKSAQARMGLLKIAIETDLPEVRIRIITMFDKPETQNLWKNLIDSYILRFGKKNNPEPQALLLLSQYAASNDKFELSDRLYKMAEEGMFEELPNFEMQYMESLIARGQPKKALELIDELRRQNVDWVEKRAGALIDCLRAMAYYKMDDVTTGRLTLEGIVKNRTVPVAQLLVIGKRLAEMNRIEESRMAYEAAYMSENYNQQALIALVEFAVDKQDNDALFRYLPELLLTRRPPRTMLEKVRDYLASDRLLFSLKTDEYLATVEKLLNSRLVKEADAVDAP